ncbi:MAG: Ig-like domain-containing protein [Colwellia sp.]|uniref:beta strand repeat-containing protein n=1 Tax=Colwellia sp. TaxID=56799 RepID=UPI001E0BE29F|nr:Ig-like domain-containing protein [Colwellia sp.]NQY49137.1 Ig-like domain-containing protein [Colwellia sp.]
MQLLRRLSFTMLLMSMMTLVACGDGDGDLTGGGDGGGTGDAVTLTVTKSDGDLSAINNITVSATVLNNGNAVANKTVSFTLAIERSATFDPVVGTATTDANGVATIVIKVTDVKGSVNVIASYESESDNISFDSVGDGESDDGSSGAAKISLEKSAGDLSAANAITISASILSLDNGEGLEGQLVTFTLNDATMATFDPAIGTAVTDASGIASIIVKVTDVAGGVEVTATATGLGSDTGFTKIGFTSVGDGVKVIVGEPVAASIRLFASSPQIASSGAQTIELSVIAKDENNNLLEGVTINFAANSGALAKIIDNSGNSTNVTGPDGKVSMMLSTEDEPSNRTILVTVTSGDISDSLEIDVVGTILTLTGSSSLALDDKTNYIVKVLDSDGNGVAKTDVAISLGGGEAGIELPTPALVTTDAEGQATIQVTGVSSGTNTLVITALGASANQSVSVQADSFLFTNFSNGVDTVNPSDTPIVPDVSLLQTATVTLTWQRNGSPVSSVPVGFTTTRGVLSVDMASTNVNGEVTATLTSNNAGKALVTFVGTDTFDGKVIELTNQLEFEFYADTAATIIAQASPSSIGPNQQTSTISVVVRDVNRNLVKNKTIKFEVDDISGGEIFPATAVTDSNGSASTVYTSNNTSAHEGVAITATVIGSLPIVTDTVNLTVADRELFITLGTGNTIEEPDVTDYIKEFSVFVTDVDSNPVANVELTISLIPERYYKGYWTRLYDGDKFKVWITDAVVGDVQARTATIFCDNEDINLNGILDFGEDTNNDGLLTPGNVAKADGTVTTDEDGRAIVKINYGQSYAHWVDIHLIASANVTGSESLNQTIFTLPVAANDVNSEDLTPPTQGVGLEGPFGGNQNCSVPD